MPQKFVGGPLFEASVADSSITTPNVPTGLSCTQPLTAADEDITASFLADYAEVGDGGNSDEEGEESKEHFDTLMEDLQTQHFQDESNDMDLTNAGILGAPSG